VSGENYFVSFSRLPFQKMILVNLIAEKKVLLIQKVMLRQVVTFLVLLGSISLLVGTLSARWLTIHLDDLTLAAHELENQNFDHVVEVNSSDELGTLGQAFNSMSGRIRSLLEELQIYNTQLEQKVEERTRELQDLSNIQNAMLNSLGQGFVIVNKSYEVLPVYSKVAVDMFEVVPSEQAPGDIMGIKAEDAAPFKEFFDLVFNQVIDFDDMVKMNPDFRSNSKDQKIQLSYAPIRSTETEELEYVLIIGTDKTTELENIAKFQREWNFSQMMMKIVGNRFSLNKVLKESLGMLDSALDALESGKAFAVKDVQRYVHTIKGSFSYFNISNITELSHSFESYLEPYFKEEHCSDEVKMSALFKIQEIQIAIENFIHEYDQLIQYKSSNTHKAIPYATLENFTKLLGQANPELLETFTQEFNRVDIQPFFQMYPTIVQDLGLKLNKKLKFVIEGANQSLPEDNWEELFGQFIHFVRNSADHGIESEGERLERGKAAEGQIKFSFALTSDKLQITLSDDGRGIDWQKIAAKDPTVQNEQDAINRIMAGGVSSKDEVSDTSGRGVGVSAIFAVVEKWHGKITVKNTLHQGLTLSIEIPLMRKVQHLKVA
jgi:two-component system chemotaxis sensor kinase CheA